MSRSGVRILHVAQPTDYGVARYVGELAARSGPTGTSPSRAPPTAPSHRRSRSAGPAPSSGKRDGIPDRTSATRWTDSGGSCEPPGPTSSTSTRRRPASWVASRCAAHRPRSSNPTRGRSWPVGAAARGRGPLGAARGALVRRDRVWEPGGAAAWNAARTRRRGTSWPTRSMSAGSPSRSANGAAPAAGSAWATTPRRMRRPPLPAEGPGRPARRVAGSAGSHAHGATDARGRRPRPVEHRAARLAGVRLVGDHEDVRPWLRAADVVVQPSSYETMALSMLEAMSMGRSVVATDIEGAREALGPRGGIGRRARHAG